jgi:hypothetical protein
VGFSSVLRTWERKDNAPLPVTAKFVVRTNLTIKKLQMNCKEELISPR